MARLLVHVNTEVFSMILHFYEEDGSNPVSSNSVTIIGLAYPTLIGFLGLKYAANQVVDPFLSHPKITRIAIFSLLLYCMLITIHQRCSSHNNYRKYAVGFFRARMLFSGLSLALTSSLFIADAIRPIVCVATVLFCIADLLFKKLIIIVEWSGADERNLYWPFRHPSSNRPSLPV